MLGLKLRSVVVRCGLLLSVVVLSETCQYVVVFIVGLYH